ncbi:MAG: serine/threonine-protein kinase [bacterium]|nr:serine/threonine protein kinase [Myxococcales bacterium]MCB9543264.1 serine/threonine protein kinase [Myxococcales bacterium]MCB9551877.1 serine/threonine protein kinase [Myxococcales bacterium]
MTDKPSDDKNSLIGRTIDNGRYEITRLIGEGGMGRVYEARQVSMNRRVALKILRAQLATDEKLLARFQQEALSISRLRHPNTITIYDYGKTEDDLLFMSMELLGGQSLFSILRKEKRLILPRALHIMDQVAGAVGEAHQLGIVHRDLKPENIQIDHVAGDSDFAKVLDFGIAKILGGDGRTAEGKALTLAGSIFGTPHYMSPEQVHGQKVDHRTDIYSLGIILFEMLAGKPPFDGATPMSVMMAQASKELPDMREMAPEADVNDAVLQLINDCCAKDRSRRLRTADELIARLRQIQIDLGELSSTNSRLYFAPASGVYRMTPRPGDSGPYDRSRLRANTAPIAPIDGSEPPPRPPSNPGLDGLATPEHAGHLATVPPRPTDPRIRPYGPDRRLRWAMVTVAAAALAVALFAWQTADEGIDDHEGTLVIDSRVIVYTLQSDPPGAAVLVDGLEIGRTPTQYDVPRGRETELLFRREGYKDQSYTASGRSASPNQTIRVALEANEPIDAAPPALPPPIPPAPPRAWLDLHSEPEGAEVFLGELKLGVTPFEHELDVTEAPVELRFVKEGHEALVRTVALEARGAAPTEIRAELKKRPAPPIRRPQTPRPPKPPPETPKQPDKPTYEKL